MKRLLLSVVSFFLLALCGTAQVSINTDGSQPHPSAGLDVKFTNKGILPPRMTSAQRNAIQAPAAGLIIFNSDCNDIQFFNGYTWWINEPFIRPNCIKTEQLLLFSGEG